MMKRYMLLVLIMCVSVTPTQSIFAQSIDDLEAEETRATEETPHKKDNFNHTLFVVSLGLVSLYGLYALIHISSQKLDQKVEKLNRGEPYNYDQQTLDEYTRNFSLYPLDEHDPLYDEKLEKHDKQLMHFIDNSKKYLQFLQKYHKADEQRKKDIQDQLDVLLDLKKTHQDVMKRQADAKSKKEKLDELEAQLAAQE